MTKLKKVKDWILLCEDKEHIEAELRKWLQHFIEVAEGKEGNVIECDFDKFNVKYYTDCKDILDKDPECKSAETNPRIRRRKQAVFLQLFIKTLLDEVKIKKMKYSCSHCGCEDVTFNGIHNGHYLRCPKCKKIDLIFYEPEMEESINDCMKKIGSNFRLEFKQDMFSNFTMNKFNTDDG